MPDWIDFYVTETQRVPSPEIFRLWSGITAISGVLERKVWTTGSAGPIYPNLFTLLVGPPACGKDNAIRPIKQLWSKISGLHLSPDNMTKAAMMDALKRSVRTVMNGRDTPPLIFQCMVAPVPEFGVFIPRYDNEFLSTLNNLYMSPDTYTEERRTQGIIELSKPHLVILAGTQPDFLYNFLPEEAWGMGFTSRLIMVYADGGTGADYFTKYAVNSTDLLALLRKIFELKGEFIWDAGTVEEINAWSKAGCPPRPEHSKLLNYNGRRGLHVIKLCMISAASRAASLHVTVEDFERAREWLLSAEAVMPDIFRAMGQRSDQQILEDLYEHLYRLWSSVAREKRRPLPDKELYGFLHTRVPTERIPRLIEAAQKLGYITKGVYPDEWTPRPRTHFGTM